MAYGRAAELATAGAAHIADAARRAVAVRGRCSLALSGGATPMAMLAQLATAPGMPAWKDVHVFQVDERVAPDGHPDRNFTGLRDVLLDKVSIPVANIHPMPVTEPDLQRGAEEYANQLRGVCGDPPVLDVVHLGLGEDGHTASLVPEDPVLDVRDRDVAVTGTYEGRQRMTLTYPALDRARDLVWLVSGRGKAAAALRLVEADPTAPAGRVNQDHATLLVSLDALPRSWREPPAT